MARKTKAEIEQALLAGDKLTWKEGEKAASIQLTTAEQRRLLAYVLSANVHNPKGLPPAFISGLKAARAAVEDPATSLAVPAAATATKDQWKVSRIETESFGGLNYWGGPPFIFDFNAESILFEGPNGSGKSSLISAFIWCLSGERPREGSASSVAAHEAMPVYSDAGSSLGNWPPLACYPPNKSSLSSAPTVRVKITFRNSGGVEAHAERAFSSGTTTFSIDPAIVLPPVLLEAGLLMPARMSALRFGDGQSSLAEAVKKLTGLDELADLGIFVGELIHGAREFLSYARTQGRDGQFTKFEQHIETARQALLPLKRSIPDLKPVDAVADDGLLATLKAGFGVEATALLDVIKADLAVGIDLSSATDQQKVAVNIDRAREEVAQGLAGLPTWKTLRAVSDAVPEPVATNILATTVEARVCLSNGIALHQRTLADSKFRLKAAAATWHAAHAPGTVDNCPLCDKSLSDNPDLAAEIEELKAAGAAAARSLEDSVNGIINRIDSVLPASVRRFRAEGVVEKPAAQLATDIRKQFISADKYDKCLTGIATLFEGALSGCPADEPTFGNSTFSADVAAAATAIDAAERIVVLAAWMRANEGAWSVWWSSSVTGALPAKLQSIDDAVKQSAPYRSAVAALDSARSAGKLVAAIDSEQDERKKIAEGLSAVKDLKKYVDAEAKDAIDGLSGKMATWLERIYVLERLKFRSALIDKKNGVSVRGAFSSDYTIDATTVANTSWLRALLWSFVFAIRSEAVEQVGRDDFPVVILDDPQATFDVTHRLRWSQVLAGMQVAGAQIVVATHDSSFAEELVLATFTSRRAQLVSAGPEIGHVYVIEGAALVQAWEKAKVAKTQKAAVDYIADVRIHVEAILKLMLRGENVDPLKALIGDLRAKISQLHAGKVTPWSRTCFGKLVGLLNSPKIKYMESSHHSTSSTLSFSHAEEVEEFWRKDLNNRVSECLSQIREYRMFYGESKALHAAAPTASLPAGHRDAVRGIPMQVLGRASAFTSGRVADGELSLMELGAAERDKVVLAQHDAYRIAAPTLEPVARVGDVLLVKEDHNPPVGALVVALHEDRLLARRYLTSANHPDIAVLTAHANNPKEIAAPVIAQFSTVRLSKIVGVLFDSSKGVPKAANPNDDEIVDCGGDAAINSLKAGTFGLVEVVGDSAQPQALDKQYLLVKGEVDPATALKNVDGIPVIAADSDNHQYFKRLRMVGGTSVVLESLDGGGHFPPILLGLPGQAGVTISRIWPVAGVLFERP